MTGVHQSIQNKISIGNSNELYCNRDYSCAYWLSAWFLEKSWLLVAFSLVLLVIMVIKFLPTARAALVKTGSRKNLAAELLRRDKDKGR